MADFEPKKREVIELATDTGEHVTQSRDALNVRKGNTSTDSLENVDISHGFSAASAASMGAGGASASGSISGSETIDQGFRSIHGSNVENVVTTDASREKRESFSHSASINQLYHLLDSYHLATNRALFFLNARPHMIQSPYTFVNGPRELEGIQEFFLIVKRPIAMKEICVKATLETAHLYISPPDQSTTSAVPPPQDQGSLSYHFHLNPAGAPAGGAAGSGQTQTDSHPFLIPDGHTIDTSRGGTPITIHFDRSNTDVPFSVPLGMDCTVTRFASGIESQPQIQQISDNLIQVTVTANGWPGAGDTDGHVEIDFTVYTKLKPPATNIQAPQEVDLFLTGRAVSNCKLRLRLPHYVSYEVQLTEKMTQLIHASRGSAPEAVYAANAVSRELRKQVISSYGRPGRYTEGEVDFLSSRFALRAATATISRDSAGLAEPLTDNRAVDDTIRRTIARVAPDLTVGEAISQAPENLASRTGITTAQARVLLGRMLGLVTGGSGAERDGSIQ